MRRATVWARPPYRSYKASIPSGEWAEIERTMSSSLRCTLMLRHTLGGCASVGTDVPGGLDHAGTRRLGAGPRDLLLRDFDSTATNPSRGRLEEHRLVGLMNDDRRRRRPQTRGSGPFEDHFHSARGGACLGDRECRRVFIQWEPVSHDAVDGEARVAQPLANRTEGSLAVRLTAVRRGAANGELTSPDERPLDLVPAGAAAEDQRATGTEQAHREVNAQRRGAAVEHNVDATIEHGEPPAGGSHQACLHVLGGLLQHLFGRSVPDTIGADRSDRHEGCVRIAVERSALTVAPAETRPCDAP